MKARIDYTNVPEALRGMYQLEHYIHNSAWRNPWSTW
jgi:hypothetical protein